VDHKLSIFNLQPSTKHQNSHPQKTKIAIEKGRGPLRNSTNLTTDPGSSTLISSAVTTILQPSQIQTSLMMNTQAVVHKIVDVEKLKSEVSEN